MQVSIATASEDEIRKYMLENITEEQFKEMMEGKKCFMLEKVDYMLTFSSIMEASADPDGCQHAHLLYSDLGYHCCHVHLRAAIYAKSAAGMGTALVCQCHHGVADSHLHCTIPACHGDEEEPQ